VKHLDRWLWGLVAALAFLLPGTPSHAGCGCDHPPPAFAPVMPPFAAPGTQLKLHVSAANLRTGAPYKVQFTTASGESTLVKVHAAAADTLVVEFPNLYNPGPVAIQVWDTSERVAFFDDSLLTGLPLPRRLPAGDGVVLIEGFTAPVSRDGVLYIPVDLDDVVEGAQFAFVMPEAPVSFGPDDVVFYNRHGVDLTLFTLAVDDPTAREWGSYYGWDVDEDAGIVGTVYETKVGASPKPGAQSDMLTYWRHEFETYAKAHAPGGTHEVDASGYHADGTWHIDHDRLVIAIRGTLDGKPLEPGQIASNLLVTMVGSEGPIEPEKMIEAAYGSTLYVETNATLTGWQDGRTADSVTLEADGTVEPLVTETVLVEEGVVAAEPVAIVAESLEDVDEPAPVANLQIAEAEYRRGKLSVSVTVDGAAGAPTVSVQGFVSNAPMKWNRRKAQYVYTASSRDDLKGRLAVVSHPNAESISQVIR